MKSLRDFSFAGALVCALPLGLWVGAAPAGAQTLTALTGFEQSLSSGSIVPALLNLPASLLQDLAGGAEDLRVQTNYNPPQNLLTFTLFVVPAGSPSPTNLGQLNPTSIIGGLTISVDKTYVTNSVVMFAGSISSNALTLYGNLQGAPATFSFAYSGDTPPKIVNVMELLAGTVVLYSPTATGNVTITKPSTGGGGGATGITIVVTGGAGVFPNGTNAFEGSSNLISLDASKTTSSSPGALTYSWTAVPAGAAGIYFANTASPVFQFFGKGTYTVMLTVTDATGATAKQTFLIQYD
jgi:K319L-like, PKD domain